MLFNHEMVAKRAFYEEATCIPLIISGKPVVAKRGTVEKKLGQMAAELLLKIIKDGGEREVLHQIVVEPELIVRDSTKKAKKAGGQVSCKK